MTPLTPTEARKFLALIRDAEAEAAGLYMLWLVKERLRNVIEKEKINVESK